MATERERATMRPWRTSEATSRTTIQGPDFGTGLPQRDTVARAVRPADAALIVRAVNAHDAALALAEAVEDFIVHVAQDHACNEQRRGPHATIAVAKDALAAFREALKR